MAHQAALAGRGGGNSELRLLSYTRPVTRIPVSGSVEMGTMARWVTLDPIVYYDRLLLEAMHVRSVFPR